MGIIPSPFQMPDEHSTGQLQSPKELRIAEGFGRRRKPQTARCDGAVPKLGMRTSVAVEIHGSSLRFRKYSGGKSGPVLFWREQQDPRQQTKLATRDGTDHATSTNRNGPGPNCRDNWATASRKAPPTPSWSCCEAV